MTNEEITKMHIISSIDSEGEIESFGDYTEESLPLNMINDEGEVITNFIDDEG